MSEPNGAGRSVWLVMVLYVQAYFAMVGFMGLCEDLGVYAPGGDRWGKYRLTAWIVTSCLLVILVTWGRKPPPPR